MILCRIDGILSQSNLSKRPCDGNGSSGNGKLNAANHYKMDLFSTGVGTAQQCTDRFACGRNGRNCNANHAIPYDYGLNIGHCWTNHLSAMV
jgi:hypothetical protein